MGLNVLDCRTPYRQLIQGCSNEHIIFLIHEALGNKLSYRYIVTNPSFLNIVINPSFLKLYASSLCISQFQLRPFPPRATAGHLRTRGWGISKFAYPGATPGVLTHYSKSKLGGFYRKGPPIRRRLDRPSWTGQTSGGFLGFMHFFIAYQGTT